MRIRRSIAIDGTLCPAAVTVLGMIPPEMSFHVPHQLRHPESIYRFSLEKVGAAFCEVAKEDLSKTDEYRNRAAGGFDVADLLKKQEGFLRAMQEHLDDCWLILKALIDPARATKTSSFAEDYVIGNRLPGAKSFRDAIAGHKNSLFIANRIKHGQGRLRGVSIWLPEGPSLGYFLEEPDSTGVIAPSAVVHPDQGAFSFARDLRQHLANLYNSSEQLVKAIERAVSAQGGRVVRKPASGIPLWTEVLSLAASLPAAYFPKELKKGVAGFQLDAALQVLKIRSPEHPRIIFPVTIHTTCSTIIDGHSPTFKVPIP